ncbi:MAG: ParA family protein [Leptolyngbyaceae cyanobacterium]
MTLTIAFVNQSGGVGKTSLVVNIGHQLAEKGYRVLLIDMDSQASLTKYLDVDPRSLEESVFDAIITGSDLPIQAGLHKMDLVPANRNLVTIDAKLATTEAREFRLQQVLTPHHEIYDFILIDCPPNLGLLSLMSLVAATHVLIPIKTNEKGLEGADDLRETIGVVLQRANPQLKIAGAVPMMYDSRRVHDRLTLEEINKMFGKYTVHSAIPIATDFDNAWRARQPLAVFQPKHPAVESLRQIASNLEQM